MNVTLLLLATLAAQPRAGASVEVVFHGEVQVFSPKYKQELTGALEELAVHSGFAAPLAGEIPPADLAVVVHFPSPVQLTLRTPVPRDASVGNLVFLDDDALNDGWPLLFVSSSDRTWSLAKYDGGAVLDFLCSDELRPRAARAVTSNCHLAPSRRPGRDGSPEASDLDPSRE